MPLPCPSVPVVRRRIAPSRPTLFALLLGVATSASAQGVAPTSVPAAGAPASAVVRDGDVAAEPPRAAIDKPADTTAASPIRQSPANGASYAGRAELPALARAIADAHGLDEAWVATQLGRARYNATVARLMMPPVTAGGRPATKDWAAYRARFVEPQRLKAGAAFWDAHADALAAAEARTGVPPSLVVGIIGVETFYGRNTGSFAVLDALATLALDFPKGRRDRTPFFRDELGHFLAMARHEGMDPASIKGSYAGAIGLGQFMPGSIRRHAVDGDGDGRIDMAANPDDVIASVANYLRNHGWTRGMPTHLPVEPPADPALRAELLAPDIVPTFSRDRFEALGARLPAESRGGTTAAEPLALIELPNGDTRAPSYVAGTPNFYTVTRYNWSSLYAMAVIELGEAVAKWRAKR